MPQKLAKIFRPKSVAVVGASVTEASVGRTVLENLKRAEFSGQIYPVNPTYDIVLNRRHQRMQNILRRRNF